MTPYRLKGASGAFINQVFPLTARVRIGSGEDADIRLPSDEVGGADRTLATLVSGSSEIRLQVQADDIELAVNGERVTGEQLLGQGDELRVGQWRFVVQAPGLRPERILQQAAGRTASASRWPWLVAATIAVAAAAAVAWQQGWLTPAAG